MAQGVVLAAVVKDPWGFDPANDARQARGRFDWIVKSMRGLGWVTGDVAYPKVAPAGATGPNGAVVDQVEQELVAPASRSRAGRCPVTCGRTS